MVVGIIWAGLIRRRVRRETETIRQREEALEGHYRDLFENAHDIIFTLDLSGNLASLNKAGEQILGYPRQEAAGLNFAQLVAPRYRNAFQETLARLSDGPSNAG